MKETVRTFAIRGMRCAGCAKNIEKAVNALPDAGVVVVNYATGLLSLTAPAKLVSDADVINAVAKLGFTAEIPEADFSAEEAKEAAAGRKEMLQLVIAALFTAILLVLSMLHLPSDFRINTWLQLLCLLPVLYGGKRFFISGLPALFRGHPDMDSLISCGAGIGIIYSVYLWAAKPAPHLYFDAAAMIITLVMLGKTLENCARRKASGAMRELLRLTPETAILCKGDSEVQVVAAALKKDDIVLIRPGERFPADGTVITGTDSVDEAMLTGESRPVTRSAGDEVKGGTVNLDGVFKVKVSAIGSESILGRIIKLVADAQNSKPPAARLADKVAGVFTWIIFGCAAVTAAFWLLSGAGTSHALNCALSVLVAACPCALGLATPIALISGIGRGAALGILIKNGTILETSVGIDVVIFDKTGTLTCGMPQVKSIHCSGTFTEKELLLACAAAERNSNHPLAPAIIEYALRYGENPEEISDFQFFPGGGIGGTINGRKWLFGNEYLMDKHNIQLAIPDDCRGGTLICCCCDGEFAGTITLDDTIRPEAAEAVKRLQSDGIECIMLTGDNPDAAKRVADALNLDDFRAGMLPQDKAGFIRQLQNSGTSVAMTGDGVNDAPALAQADIGISIGSGTPAAMESAGMILLKSDLLELPRALRLSKAVMRVIRQNLFWAFFYNFAALPAAAGALNFIGIELNPAICAGTMAASSLTVVLNALRLLKFK